MCTDPQTFAVIMRRFFAREAITDRIFGKYNRKLTSTCSENGWEQEGANFVICFVICRNHHSREALVAHTLIGSDRVEGTAVYGQNGKSVGKIERIMIDKLSGQVAYAVLSFGGFLGLGHDHYPLPWNVLKYDTEKEGYVAPITEKQLENAPKFGPGDDFDWGHRENVDRIQEHYSGWA
jgi:hypothetical protein